MIFLRYIPKIYYLFSISTIEKMETVQIYQVKAMVFNYMGNKDNWEGFE